MKRCVLRAACCVLLLLAACERAEEEATAPDAVAVDRDRDNLLSLAHGATIVSRSAELTLENSAVHAIDGDSRTYWKSPGGETDQTIVFSLPARTRIDRVGVISATQATQAPQFVRYEASDDGITWRNIGTVALTLSGEPTTIAVPFEASYLRAHTIEHYDYYTTINSFVAYGREIVPVEQPRIEGCWTINGAPSRFVQRGTSVAGVIGVDRPVYVSGATDGRALRLTWLRGPMWGPALITLDPQRRALSGVRWHEEVGLDNSGDGWFGAPAASCDGIAVDETQIASQILQRAGKWVAYGDSALDTLAALIRRSPSQKFRIVARTAKRLDAVRVALRARGVNLGRLAMTVLPVDATNEPQRVIADGVELHLR